MALEDLNFPEGGGEEGLKYASIQDKQTRELSNKLDNDTKVFLLILLLKKQPHAADFMWSLFRSSCEGYKFDSLLRPFPKMFLDENGEKNVNRLRSVAASATSIPQVLSRLEEGSISKELTDLLFWVLIRSHSFEISSVKKTEFTTVVEKVQETNAATAFPSHIFEVDHSARASSAKFQALAQQYGTRFAFHGSRVENYFSILHHGLQVSMNKVAAFGPGVYLSSELTVSLPYSPSGLTWGGSAFGGTLSVVAVCEMIDHPDVKCQDDKMTERKYAEGTRSSQVPRKYFIVQNSDLVRVSHLLVYTTPSRALGRSYWARLGSMPVVIIGYLVVLLAIALFNSPNFTRKLRSFF